MLPIYLYIYIYISISISLYLYISIYISNYKQLLLVQFQAAVTDVDQWCTLNRINLNVSKTKMCCYGTRHHLENFEIKLKLKDCELGKCKQYTYLGVTLDEIMNLESNFNATFKKFSYKIFQFSKIRKYLPPDVRVLVYKQTVLPMVEYISYLLYIIVGAVMSEKGVRCFFRGKSNLKTVLESLRGLLLGIQCCQKIFSMAT